MSLIVQQQNIPKDLLQQISGFIKLDYMMDLPILFEHIDLRIYFKNIDNDILKEYSERYGCLEIVKYLRSVDDFPIYTDLVSQYCKLGHFEIVKYLINLENSSYMFDYTKCITHAVLDDNINTIKFFYFNNFKYTDRIIKIIISNGRLEIFKFLHEQKCVDMRTELMDYSSRHNKMNVLQYLYDNGCR